MTAALAITWATAPPTTTTTAAALLIGVALFAAAAPFAWPALSFWTTLASARAALALRPRRRLRTRATIATGLSSFTRRTLGRVWIARRPALASVPATATATAAVAATALIRPIRIARLIGTTLASAILRRPSVLRRSALGRWTLINRRNPATTAILRSWRPLIAMTIRSAALLIAVGVAILISVRILRLDWALGLTLALRTRSARSRTGSWALAALLAIVRTGARPTAAVAKTTLAFTPWPMSVKFFLGAPRDFTAARVVLGHERGG